MSVIFYVSLDQFALYSNDFYLSSVALLFNACSKPREMTYNTKWVLFQQVTILFLLYFTPGSQFDAIPIYLAQAYLLAVSLIYTNDEEKKKPALESAATLLIVAAAAGVVSALAALNSMNAVYDITIGTIHFAVMVAVAIVLISGSAHIIRYVRYVEQNND